MIKLLILSIIFLSSCLLSAKGGHTSYIVCKYPSGWFHTGHEFKVQFVRNKCVMIAPKQKKLRMDQCIKVKKDFRYLRQSPSNLPPPPRRMKRLAIEVNNNGNVKKVMVPISPNDNDKKGKAQNICENIVGFLK